MTVEFFIHRHSPENQNERQALVHIVRLLQHQFEKKTDHYVFVGDINPQKDPRWAGSYDLTQLDGLLFGPDFITLVEIKECSSPIDAPSLHERWYTRDNNGKDVILYAGKAVNAFQQVRKARNKWIKYFQQQSETLFSRERAQELKQGWRELSTALLFSPYLHPDSNKSQMGDNEKWLTVDSINRFPSIAWAAHSDSLQLTKEEVERLVYYAIRAEDWIDIYQLIAVNLGYIRLYDNEQEPTRYPIYAFDNFTVGRSNARDHRIVAASHTVSSTHLQLASNRTEVSLTDLGSMNGTQVIRRRAETAITETIKVPQGEFVVLQDKDEIILGTEKCKLIFYKARPITTISTEYIPHTQTPNTYRK